MSFKIDKLTIPDLDLTKKGQQLFPPILKDYLAGDNKLDVYYRHKPSLDSFDAAIESKSQENIDRYALVKVLVQQYSGIEDVPANIDLLGDENTFTITTGHQLCLFTGPLYLCYKILTVVNLTEQLKERHPDKNFIPLFWMATEDHDFEEVNHFHIFGKKVTWEAKAGNAVGRMSTKGLQKIIDGLKSLLSADKAAAEVLQVFERAYLKWDNLADATRVLIHELFGKYGVVVLDADNPDLKKSFRQVMEAEIESNASMNSMVDTYQKLSESYKLPVKSRDINLFYFKDEKRYRLEVGKDNTVNVVNGDRSFDNEDIIKLIDEDPERFSPNVVLRPLYQEMILPNLAYIGGPSEIAYWLELKQIFDDNNVSFPVLMPRNSLLLLGTGETKRMSQFNLSPSNLFSDPAEQVKEIVSSASEDNLSLAKEKEELTELYKKLIDRATEVDPSLEQSVKADQTRALGQLDNLEKKLLKAAKKKNSTVVNQVDKLFEGVFPSGVFQERYDSLFSVLIKHNLGIIDEMKRFIDPFDFSLKVLREEKD